ncbi:sensor histidine kinase [Lichenihabitans psoromatis]|uniref:sensor histidine kinase n=1 Tax=Lichenihabitans psoromatis TaxID=2528642 RepID=UPI001035AB53|nr:HAMP domain-containing sensor histidine kinase [Lichenihabitans psoromatis]
MTALGKLFRTTVFKLSLAYLIIFGIGAGFVLGGVAWNVNLLLDEQIGQTVEAEITGLAEQYETGGMRHLVDIIERRSAQPGSSLYLVTNYAGEKLAGNVTTLPSGVIDHPGLVETPYERPNDKGQNYTALARIFLLPGGFRLMVGRDLDERESLRKVITHALITSLLWLAGIGTFGGIVVARRVLHRVDAMSDSAATIMTGDLTRRLPTGGTGDELDRLAQNLNAMLDRIGELMTGMKEVSDNIAHDLRTPLTRLRNGAEQALRTAKTPEDYRHALDKTIEEADRLMSIFSALLMIARAEAGSSLGVVAPCDISSVVRDVVELYEPSAEEAHIELRSDVQPDLVGLASRELIGQAVANLIDNALKYGARTSNDPAEAMGADSAHPALIEVSVSRDRDAVVIVVADRGPGIAAVDRSRVLERFVRLEGARSRPGSGLGLSMAAAVARLHHGELRIQDNAPGLRVVLSLPALDKRHGIEAPRESLLLPRPVEAARVS